MAAGIPDLRRGPHGHAVLFYRDGDDFAGQVGAHLLEAIRVGGMAVLVATPAHRAAVAAELARAGVDVAAAHEAGRYIALDASQTMDRFVIADWPDTASFWNTMGPLVRRADQAGLRLHLAGEIVALLWDFGQVGAALELEALWNEVGAQYTISLLCAYPAGSVSGEAHQDSLAELYRAHTDILGDVPGHG